MKTLHTIYMNFAKRFAIVLFFLTTLGLSSAWAATTGKITFGNGGTSISSASVTGTDNLGNTWKITTTGTNAFPLNNVYAQVGTSSDPAASITFTMTLPAAQRITAFSAKFGGFGSTDGSITLKVGNQTIGSDVLNTVYDVVVSNTSEASGTVLTVSVNNITGGGVKCYEISYTYESTTTHEVTWIANDIEVKKESIAEGTIAMSQLPPDPDDCSPEVVFVGWTAIPSVDGSKPADLFNSKTPAEKLPIISASNKTFYAVYATQTEAPAIKTDNMTRETTGVANQTGSASYIDWSGKSLTSPAEYAGNSAGMNNSIHLRDKSASGIITTKSGGKAKKVVIQWNSNTRDDAELKIYGKNVAYSRTSELYDTNTQGTLIGTIDLNSTTLDITDDYEYIGMSSLTGAIYLTSIAITWESEGSFENYTTTCSVDVTVTLNPNGGTGNFTDDWIPDGSKYTQTVKKDNSVTLPTLDDQIAYTFGGWSDGNAVIPAGDYTPKEDVELIAVWNPKPLKDYRTLCTYDILLDKNNTDAGSVDGSATITSTYTLLENITAPTRTGYTIEGYYAEEECITKVAGVDGTLQSGVAGYTDADGKWIAEDIEVIYTKWTANQYTITFDQQGGQGGTESVEATYGNKLPDITTPTREGYSFGGYFTEADGAGTQYYNIEGTAYRNKIWNETAPRTLYAKWTAHTYVVKFNANGGSGVMDDQTFTYDQAQPLSANAFTRTGYTFTKWNDKANGTGTSYADKQSVINLTSTKGGQKTIYAQWTANTNTLYVVEHYQQNLDLSYPTDPTEKESFTGTTDTKVTPTVKTYEGFTSPATQEVTIAADGSLVVRYEYKRNSYKLTWDLAGGDITAAGTAAGNVLYGTELKAPRVAKVDNVFMGWEPEIPATMPAHDATYVAQWIELTNFRTFCKNSVTWVVNGGKWADGTTADIVDIYTRGQEIIPPTDPTLDGWKFMGWDPEFVEGTTMQGNDHIYTAQWAKAYTVTYDANGGSTTCEDNNEYVANDIVTVCNNRPTKVGYTFEGWMRNDNNAKVQPDATFAMPENDVTLIAQWTANTNTPYVVEHYQQALDGTYPTPTEREELAGTTDTQVTPAVKSYDGFTAPATQTVIIAAAGNLVVKYQYTRNSYQLAWDLDGGTVITAGTAAGTILFGAPLTAPVVEKVGHTFKAWEPTVPTNMPANDATYKAIWEVASHTVTWDPAGGHWEGDHNKKVETYEYGAEIVKPANPEKTGYAFIGWQPEVEEIMQNSDLTYTAQWGEEFCKNYSFHWGSGTEDQVRNDNHQACFTQKDDTHEWQVTHFTIPADTKYFVGLYGWWYWSDLGVGDSNGQKSKSVMKEWTWTGDQVMYLAHVGRGYTLGHAVGAVGTLRIYDNTSLDNLDVAFIPNGYGITLTSNSSSAKTAYAFRTTAVNRKWETDVVKMPGITNNKYTVGLATQVDGEYVASNHSKAPENLEKMGVTEIVEGKKMIYLKPNDSWITDNARFAAYFFGNGEKWVDMTDVDGDTIYACAKPDGFTSVIFCRMNPATTANNWTNTWNQTQDIALSTDGLAKVCTITGWDRSSTIANASPKSRQNGKFRMWDNSTNENWFVHFVPYYLLNYDPNGGEGEMEPTEYNTEDANNKVTVAANEFTRTGYDFVSWNTKADGTGTTYNPGDLFTMTADTTIYAIWKAQDYQITYRDQGDEDYSGSNEAELPKTHTYDKATELVDGEKIGYTFEGWYDNPDCTGDAITKLGAKDYTADITLYAKWTFAMEYNITNTETIFITSAEGQNIKATQPLILEVSNMPVGTTINLSAGEHIHFYYANEEIKQLTNKNVDETFELEIAYKPVASNTTEKPSITLNVLDHEKVIADLISCRSLPETFVIAAKWGDHWYALPANMDSQTSTDGWLIEVNDKNDPSNAIAAPNTFKYSLKSVYTSNRAGDRFNAYGKRLVFVENVTGTNKSLYNGGTTTNKTSIQVYAKYENYYADDTQATRYEWIPSTTNLKDYTLTSAITLSGDAAARTISLDNHGVFGTLLQDKSYNGLVRLLPVDNFYAPVELQVVEWKADGVNIMYTGNGTKATTQIGNGTARTVLLSDAKIDHAVYTLSTSDLTTATNQPLIISIKDDADATIGAIKLTIPAVINGNKNSTELVNSLESAKATDIVILDGATLEAGATKYTYDNITVYPGGSLIIGKGTSLGMYTLNMRAGSSWGADEYENKYPHFLLVGDYSNTSGQINLDYVTTVDYYYPLSVPEQVKIKEIKYPADIYGSNVEKANTGSFQLKYYDGAQRVEQGSQYGTGWQYVDETVAEPTLAPNQGYAIWGIPVKINGTRQTYGIHRIPIKIAAGTLKTNESTDEKVDIKAHGVGTEGVSPNDQGWNYLGNPYFAQLGSMDDSNLQMGLLVQETTEDGDWTGGWVNNGKQVRYITITKDCQNFEAIPVADATISPFTTFFVQAAATGKIAFTAPAAQTISALAACQYIATQASSKEITTGILLTGNDQTDRTGLLISDEFTEEYDFNADLSKFENSGINLYTIGKTGKLAYMAINQTLAEQPIPVGYSATADGEYIIAFDEDRYNASDISALYLIDYDRNETTNLLHYDYTFHTAAGTYNERFALQVAFIPENATNVELVEDATIYLAVNGNNLLLNNLPGDATITIYDAVGHTMYNAPATQTEMQIMLPTGYYLVRIANKQQAVVIDTIIP